MKTIILNFFETFLSSSHELRAGHHEVPSVVQVLVAGRLDKHGHRVVIIPHNRTQLTVQVASAGTISKPSEFWDLKQNTLLKLRED